MKRKALVTGGAGFIGSTLVSRLVDAGWDVRVLDNLSTGKREYLKGILAPEHLVEGSITDPDTVDAACQGIDTVFHLAAVVSVVRSMDEPGLCHDINVTGFLHVLEGARKAGVRRVIYSTSAATYGDLDRFPLTEDCPLHPISPYGLHKLTNEHYAGLYARAGWVETIGLKYFNVFGPRQNPRGEYAAVIPRFIEAFLGKAPLKIYGDGSQTRDFLFVEDIASANLAAAQSQGASGAVVNCCSGRETSLMDLVRLLQGLSGIQVTPDFQPARAGEILRSVGDPTLAAKLIGFTPQVSLSQGLARTLAWFEKSASRNGFRS